MTKRPLIGISPGDATGIGPEITLKTLLLKDVYEICRPLVVGDSKVLASTARFCGLPLKIRNVTCPADGGYQHGIVDVLDMQNVDLGKLEYKKTVALTGKAAFEDIKKVIDLALARELDGVVTGPVNKEAISCAGIHLAAHADICGALTGAKDYAVMLADGDFRIAHVSTHVSLQEAIKRVKKPRILRVIQLADAALKKLGIARPRVAVAALNPRCGEGGLFGREEIDEICPAIAEARKEGLAVVGPISPDVVFTQMRADIYDVVVVMHHDQGHFAMKFGGFHYDSKMDNWSSVPVVNVTLGLPIIRSSVDYGVSSDRAGEGRANPQSMIQALNMAVQLAGAPAEREPHLEAKFYLRNNRKRPERRGRNGRLTLSPAL